MPGLLVAGYSQRATSWRCDVCRSCEIREYNRTYYRRRTASRPGRHWTRPVAQAVDEIAVERAMAGDPGDLSVADCYEAVRRLTEQGLSMREIGRRLRISPRSVGRYRTRPQPVVSPCSEESA